MNSTLFKDVNGNVSSKRIAAFIALGVAFFLTGYMVITKTVTENKEILVPWLVFAGGCLGITVAERKNTETIQPTEQEDGK